MKKRIAIFPEGLDYPLDHGEHAELRKVCENPAWGDLDGATSQALRRILAQRKAQYNQLRFQEIAASLIIFVGETGVRIFLLLAMLAVLWLWH